MKKKILLINSVCGFGSTGRLVAELSKIEDYETLVCYGRKKDFENVNSYRFSNFFDNAFGALGTIIFDNNLNICKRSTKKLINKIKEFNPDIIHLHNLHGYYVNIKMLFEFLKEFDKPVIWTFHDCWPFTGYCPDGVNECDKYQHQCENCPYSFAYPFSLFKQKTTQDFYLKKDLYSKMDNLTIVCPSNWLNNIVNFSFLKGLKKHVIPNGINLDKFKKNKIKNNKFTIIAVASSWVNIKGIDDFNKMIPLLDKDIEFIVVGKNSNKIKANKCLEHTNSIEELVDLYSSSHLFVNAAVAENLPTVNIEALACGTPVLAYDDGGSCEVFDEKSGIKIKKGDYQEMAKTINNLKNNYYFNSDDCINRSRKYSKDNMIKEYKELYESLLVK